MDRTQIQNGQFRALQSMLPEMHEANHIDGIVRGTPARGRYGAWRLFRGAAT